MVPVIVPAYAAAFAFIYIVLSTRVIRARWQVKVALGTRGDVRLERKIRVHANFAEYVPLAYFSPPSSKCKVDQRGSYTCCALF